MAWLLVGFLKLFWFNFFGRTGLPADEGPGQAQSADCANHLFTSY
jgi:hypothetical protein